MCLRFYFFLINVAQLTSTNKTTNTDRNLFHKNIYQLLKGSPLKIKAMCLPQLSMLYKANLEEAQVIIFHVTSDCKCFPCVCPTSMFSLAWKDGTGAIALSLQIFMQFQKFVAIVFLFELFFLLSSYGKEGNSFSLILGNTADLNKQCLPM